LIDLFIFFVANKIQQRRTIWWRIFSF